LKKWRVEYIDLNGGEPTLREDLFNTVEGMIKRIPHLRQITTSSNGLMTEKAISILEDISKIRRKNRIRYSLSIRLRGVGEIFEKVSGVQRSFS
jgi:molybdenum cofactor biosynthesis enzyme MoaA